MFNGELYSDRPLLPNYWIVSNIIRNYLAHVTLSESKSR